MSFYKCNNCNYKRALDSCEPDSSDQCLCIQPGNNRNRCSCSEAPEIYYEPVTRYTNWNKKFEYLRKMWSYHGKRRKLPMAKCEYWEKPCPKVIKFSDEVYCDDDNPSEYSVRSSPSSCSVEDIPPIIYRKNCSVPQYRDYCSDYCRPAPRCHSAQSERGRCQIYEQISDYECYVPKAKETRYIPEKLKDSSTQSDSQSTDSKQTQVSLLEKFSFIPTVEIPKTESKQTQYSSEESSVSADAQDSGSNRSRVSDSTHYSPEIISTPRQSKEVDKSSQETSSKTTTIEESPRSSSDAQEYKMEYIEETDTIETETVHVESSEESSKSRTEENTIRSSESRVSSQDTRIEEIKKIAEVIVSQTIRKYSDFFPPDPHFSPRETKILTPPSPAYSPKETKIPTPPNSARASKEIKISTPPPSPVEMETILEMSESTTTSINKSCQCSNVEIKHTKYAESYTQTSSDSDVKKRLTCVPQQKICAPQKTCMPQKVCGVQRSCALQKTCVPEKICAPQQKIQQKCSLRSSSYYSEKCLNITNYSNSKCNTSICPVAKKQMNQQKTNEKCGTFKTCNSTSNEDKLKTKTVKLKTELSDVKCAGPNKCIKTDRITKKSSLESGTKYIETNEEINKHCPQEVCPFHQHSDKTSESCPGADGCLHRSEKKKSRTSLFKSVASTAKSSNPIIEVDCLCEELSKNKSECSQKRERTFSSPASKSSRSSTRSSCPYKEKCLEKSSSKKSQNLNQRNSAGNDLCLTKAIFIKTVPPKKKSQCCIFERNPKNSNKNCEFIVNNMFIDPNHQKEFCDNYGTNRSSSSSAICLENLFIESQLPENTKSSKFKIGNAKSSCNCCEKCMFQNPSIFKTDQGTVKPKTASFDARKTSKIPTMCKRTTSQSIVKFKCVCDLEKCTCNSCSVKSNGDNKEVKSEREDCSEIAKSKKSILKSSTCVPNPNGDSLNICVRKTSAKSVLPTNSFIKEEKYRKRRQKKGRQRHREDTDNSALEVMSAVFISASESASELRKRYKNEYKSYDDDSEIDKRKAISNCHPSCESLVEAKKYKNRKQQTRNPFSIFKPSFEPFSKIYRNKKYTQEIEEPSLREEYGTMPMYDHFGGRQNLLQVIETVPSNMFSDVPDVQFTVQGFGRKNDVIRVLKVKNLLGRCDVSKKVKNLNKI